MTITQRLIQLDPTLQEYNEGHWGKPSFVDPGGFTSFNDGGIECETGEFLYGLVRLLKPDYVLETGTHYGVGASYMGSALQDNLKGKLITIEFLSEIWRIANERFQKLNLSSIVDNRLLDVAHFRPEAGELYDLILLDTEPQTRFGELLQFYPFLKPGGYVFIHDLHRHMHQIPNEEHGFAWPYGPLPDGIKSLVLSGNLRPFHFSTPRGLTGFYRTQEGDYKW